MGTGASAIEGGKSTLAGTYLAEQTSASTYTLTSAQEGSKPRAAASSGVSSSPKRNKRTSLFGAQGADVCTVLPALTKLEPLLDSSEDAFWPVASPVASKRKTPAKKPVPNNAPTGAATAQCNTGSKVGSGAPSRSHDSSKASKYKTKEVQSDPEKVFERLSRPRKRRGASPIPWPRGASPTPNFDDDDEDDLAHWMSQRHDTPGCNSPTIMSISLDAGGHSRQSLEPSRSSSRARSHASHHALFDDVLQRSGSACRANTPHGGRQYAPSFWVGQRSKTLQSQLTDIRILPENSVKSYFEEEQRRQEEFRRQSLIDEKKDQRRSLLQNAVGKVKTQNQEQRPLKQHNTEEAVKWDTLLSDVMQAKRISPAVRDACEAMRLVVLGPEREDATERQKKERSYLSPMGTEDQIFQVWRFWTRIDDDNSGRVDFREFRAHLQSMPKDVAAHAEKSMKILLSKKSSFTVEDVLKVCWPCASFKELAHMKALIDDFGSASNRAPTPPLISDDDLREMIENFSFFDQDGSGSVTAVELLESGLVDSEQAKRFMRDYDEDGSGEISVWEFCEMFCPVGFRAYPEARHATDSEGNRLVHEEGWGWRVKVKVSDRDHQSGSNNTGSKRASVS